MSNKRLIDIFDIDVKFFWSSGRGKHSNVDSFEKEKGLTQSKHRPRRKQNYK